MSSMGRRRGGLLLYIYIFTVACVVWPVWALTRTSARTTGCEPAGMVDAAATRDDTVLEHVPNVLLSPIRTRE